VDKPAAATVLPTQSAVAITIIQAAAAVEHTGNMATVQITADLAEADTAQDTDLLTEHREHITVVAVVLAVILIQAQVDTDIKVLLLYDIEIDKENKWQR
jgi:hypothetical protein